MDQLNINRISGLTGYPAVQSGIRPDTGYQKGRPYIRCIPIYQLMFLFGSSAYNRYVAAKLCK
jgi:hypothetical protein